MVRAVSAAALFAAAAALAPALPQQPPPKDLPAKDVDPTKEVPRPAPSPQVIALTASATPAPVPALRYELLPRLRDRVSGNAAVEYQRAAQLRPAWPKDPEESRKQEEMIQRWEEAPPEKLPVAEVRAFLAKYAASFKALDQAARCDRCDWQLGPYLGVENIGVLLPEVQSHRELIRFQRLRIRADLAENRFDDAAAGIAVGLRMAKDVAEGPTLISMLVGITLEAVVTGEAEKWVGRPGGPNLYWALTTLPHPLIDPRPALEGETRFSEDIFGGLKDLERGPVSADQAYRALEKMLSTLRGSDDGGPAGLVSKLGTVAYVGMNLPDAKKELIALGRTPDELEKMPAAQVVALRTATVCRAMFDDQVKCFGLPYPAAQAEFARVRERVKARTAAPDADPLVRTVGLLLPAVEKVHYAHHRGERRLAGLRAVEAVRLQTAANNGTPPKALADVTVVPVPDDPATGKPFGYAADRASFTLTAPPNTNEPAHPGNSFRYEVTVRK